MCARALTLCRVNFGLFGSDFNENVKEIQQVLNKVHSSLNCEWSEKSVT